MKLSMKPWILAFIILLVSWKPVTSQIFDLNLRTGINMVPTSSNDETHGGNLPLGFHVGLKTQLWILPVLTFEPEVQYVWMHYYTHTSIPDAEFVSGISQQFQMPPEQVRQIVSEYQQRTTKTTSYIYVPLLLGYKVNHHIIISAGPELGYILGNQDKAHVKAQVGGMGIDEHNTINSTSGMNNALVGLDAAIRFRLMNKMAIEGRYSRSLKELEGSNSNTRSYYNFIQLSLLYRIFGF